MFLPILLYKYQHTEKRQFSPNSETMTSRKCLSPQETAEITVKHKIMVMRRNEGENVRICIKIYHYKIYITFKQISSINSSKIALDIQLALPVL